ncbi:hypothetical protein V8J36_05300 [Frigidibacter sp. MR17.14]|uniref:hypothetical protein n=1 Tax=Frigidibacter sp. MR17.14 TaxID=3126509 RepID=UPI0030129F4E
MIRLGLKSSAVWIPLAGGVRVQVEPIDTALVTAARALMHQERSAELGARVGDAGEDGAAEALSQDEAWNRLVTAVAKLAITDWDGVGDQNGNPIKPDPVAVGLLMAIYLQHAAFARHVATWTLLGGEKNV